MSNNDEYNDWLKSLCSGNELEVFTISQTSDGLCLVWATAYNSFWSKLLTPDEAMVIADKLYRYANGINPDVVSGSLDSYKKYDELEELSRLGHGFRTEKCAADYIDYADETLFIKQSGKRFQGIYFLRADDKDIYKIGYSNHIRTRIKQIVGGGTPRQIQTPEIYILSRVVLTDCLKRDEKWFHNKFKDCRINGEWFAVSEDAIDQAITEFNLPF